jgi:DHA1 family tetracycline resistance protein-like MFS transporter
MTAAAPAEPRKAAFIFIFITVVLDLIAVGIVAPVLPKLVTGFEGGNIASAALWTGLLATLWAAMQFFAAPIMGSLSDHFGRRPVILASNLGLGLDYVLMALAPSLSWLILGRVLSGITSASYPTAAAYIADVTPPEKRAARYGMLGAAFGLGFIIGPALGGLLGNIDLRLPFWVAAGLSLANAVYGLFILPESLPPAMRRPFSLRRANVIGSVKLLRSHPELGGLALVLCAMALAHEALPNLFVLYTDQRYGWNAATVGLALSAIGVGSSLVSMLLVRPAAKRLGESRTAVIGLVLGVAAYLVFGLAPTGSVFLIGIALVALYGIAGPAVQSLMSQRADATVQGHLQGAIGSIRAITGMIGPLLFTQLFSGVVSRGGHGLWLGAPYLLAALLLAAGLLLALRVLPVSHRQH